MNIEEVRAYCLSLPDVTEDMPWGEEVVVFRIAGKIFLALGLNNDSPHVAVKCNPDKAIDLRDRYFGVQPAFHWNKKYWNDVYLERDLTDVQIRECILESYREVVRKLPGKKKEVLP